NRRIAPSSQLMMWVWVAAGFIYSAAVRLRIRGNWGRPISIDATGAGWTDFWRSLFRCLISLSLGSVLLLQAALVTVVAFPLFDQSGDRWFSFLMLLVVFPGVLAVWWTLVNVSQKIRWTVSWSLVAAIVAIPRVNPSWDWWHSLSLLLFVFSSLAAVWLMRFASRDVFKTIR